ncbi:nucleotidyltransferase family protein [Haladaptatus halobius]|uniref:nucleotidyltransferase family protein n=1 Tax=Haladaptatus halobius TaxID=2884875 RepID=UPI001D0BC8E6|nr:nucleotidyltransferase family protein [Haladaptatus halobius]
MTNSTVVGVLLAAGTSSRFGSPNKLLRKLDGVPVVRRAAWTLTASSVNKVIVVLGYNDALVADILATVEKSVVHNPHYEEGQGTSVAQGALAAEDVGADAAVFHLGDMPCVDSQTVDALVDAYEKTDATIVVPTYDGERGNPVLFDASHFETLQRLKGDDGGRLLFKANPIERVPVNDPGIHLDVDTPEDLEELREQFQFEEEL